MRLCTNAGSGTAGGPIRVSRAASRARVEVVMTISEAGAFPSANTTAGRRSVVNNDGGEEKRYPR